VFKIGSGNITLKQDNLSILLCFFVANAPESDRRDLMSELDLMKKLKPHPHVIKLVGCVTVSGKEKY